MLAVCELKVHRLGFVFWEAVKQLGTLHCIRDSVKELELGRCIAFQTAGASPCFRLAGCHRVLCGVDHLWDGDFAIICKMYISFSLSTVST